METHQLEILIKKYNAGECTPEEKRWLEQWYLSFEWSNAKELPRIVIPDLEAAVLNSLSKQGNEAASTQVQRVQMLPKRYRKKWWQYGVAASVISVTCISILYFNLPEKEPSVIAAKQATRPGIQEEIHPGTRKASLTLGDGTVISLDSAAVASLKESDGTTIDKQHGKILYKNTAGNNSAVLYNTLNIPRGAEYELVLPDGSKVWLNAASSLRFPTRFTGKERTVYLAGEAYFEIAKNTKQPFRVIAPGDLEVEVTGTHFNVMAYHDEAFIKTTLAEGKVNIRNGKSITPMVAFQQASLEKSTQLLKVKIADVDKEIAWKKGIIEFNDDNLPYIMRQLSRWYDVDVTFEGNIPDGHYNGSIPRRATLSEVMQILKIAGVSYRLHNRSVIITGA